MFLHPLFILIDYEWFGFRECARDSRKWLHTLTQNFQCQTNVGIILLEPCCFWIRTSQKHELKNFVTFSNYNCKCKHRLTQTHKYDGHQSHSKHEYLLASSQEPWRQHQAITNEVPTLTHHLWAQWRTIHLYISTFIPRCQMLILQQKKYQQG